MAHPRSEWRPPGAHVLHRASIDLVLRRLPAGAAVATRTADVRAELARYDLRPAADGEAADAALLLDGELSEAGDHAETLLSDTVDAVRPGGWLAVTLDNVFVRPDATGRRRAWRPPDIERLLGGRGVALEGLWSPGAAARVAGEPLRLDEHADADPSLLGAGPALLAVGRTPASPADRSRVFFATLPRKAVASATLVRRPEDERLLLVFDTFKQRWTIPGGVVDADEAPEDAAVRETREEAGLTVRLTGLAGVFSATRPDRVLFVFSARPIDVADPAPLHRHEIGDAAWMPVERALRLVARHTAEQIRRGLESPGGVWRQ